MHGLRDLLRETLLHLQATRVHLGNARELAEANDFAVGNGQQRAIECSHLRRAKADHFDNAARAVDLHEVANLKRLIGEDCD
ncbi:MAG: hypothetical protein AAF726_13680, partial [Planctomycetota bacterium]